MKEMQDPWRYRCPEGHTSWEYYHTKDVYRCQYCGKFPRLIDEKTGQAV